MWAASVISWCWGDSDRCHQGGMPPERPQDAHGALIEPVTPSWNRSEPLKPGSGRIRLLI